MTTRTARSVRPLLALIGGMVLTAACTSPGNRGTGRDPAQGTSTGATTYRPDPGPGLAGVGTLPAPASAWPAAGFDARHSSATTAVGPQKGVVRWRHRVTGDATPGPVVAADGSVLAATNAGILYDLDARTGAEIWHVDGGAPYGSDLSTSPAVLAGGTILWPGPKDTLYAVSPAGTTLWTQRLGGQPLSPAVAGAHRVYVSDLAGHLSAFEITPTVHRLVWTLGTGGTDYASATVGPDGTVYTVGGDGGRDLVAVRDLGASGAIRWRHRVSAMIEVSHGVSPNGVVVLGTNTRSEYGVRADGTVAWTTRIGDYTYSSSIVRPDGKAYFGDNSGRLWTVSAATGAVARNVAPLGVGKEKVWSSPVADARGDVYWSTTGGRVHGYSRDGRALFSTQLDAGSNSSPGLGADGTLYIGTTSGEIYAIGG